MQSGAAGPFDPARVRIWKRLFWCKKAVIRLERGRIFHVFFQLCSLVFSCCFVPNLRGTDQNIG